MKVIILAAGQGTRLRPLTNHCPKCMVEVNGISIIERQLTTMRRCGILDKDITIVAGYRNDVLQKRLEETEIKIIINEDYETTNMVCSLMCAREVLEAQDDIIISYGDIIYEEVVFQQLLESQEDSAIIVDDDWLEYWTERCENPIDDAETLRYDSDDYLMEIGQKTNDISVIQSQYIGLMRFRKQGLQALLMLSAKAMQRSIEGTALWSTERNYQKMYMTDLLQGLIEEGYKLRAVHINRGWFEIDDCEDLALVEKALL